MIILIQLTDLFQLQNHQRSESSIPKWSNNGIFVGRFSIWGRFNSNAHLNEKIRLFVILELNKKTKTNVLIKQKKNEIKSRNLSFEMRDSTRIGLSHAMQAAVDLGVFECEMFHWGIGCECLSVYWWIRVCVCVCCQYPRVFQCVDLPIG